MKSKWLHRYYTSPMATPKRRWLIDTYLDHSRSSNIPDNQAIPQPTWSNPLIAPGKVSIKFM